MSKHKRVISSEIIASLEEFLGKLEDGETIKAVQVTREETPDGPMHVTKEINIKGVEI